MERSTDADLVARLAADPRAAFGDLVAAHQDLVFGICLRVTRNAATAEDVAQESFLSAYRALARYPSQRVAELRLRPWLARIALNQARNHLRRPGPLQLAQDHDPAAPAKAEPLSLAQAREERSLWARLLGGLPERYRLAVGFRHVEGLSYAEMSEVLRRPVGSIKSDVHRGVALLRAAWDAEQRRVAEIERKEAV